MSDTSKPEITYRTVSLSRLVLHYLDGYEDGDRLDLEGIYENTNADQTLCLKLLRWPEGQKAERVIYGDG